MKFVKQNPASVFLVLFVMAFVAIVTLQVMITVNQNAQASVAQIEPVSSTSDQAAIEINTSNIAPSSLSTTEIPTPLITNDIRFGVTDRYVDCHAATDITRLAIKQELELESTLHFYDTVDELFMALAQGEVDLTLCYLDPADRGRIRGENKEIFGKHMTQIGSYYLNLENSKLQIWSNGQRKASWRTKEPCLVSFLEYLRFADSSFQQNTPQLWIQNHTDEIQTWVNCSR